MIRKPIYSRPGLQTRLARRHTASAALALATFLAATACGGSTSSSSPPAQQGASGPPTTGEIQSISQLLPDAIRKKGVLNVAAESYPTAVIVPPNGGAPTGWEPAMADDLGQILGIRFQFNVVPFASIIPGLAANRFDISMGEIAVNPDRRKVVYFVTDHASTDSFMTNIDSKVNLSTETALCGRKVAVLVGSVEADFVNTVQTKCADGKQPAISIQTYQSQPEVNLALESGRAEVDVASTGSLVPVTEQAPGKFKVSGSYNPKTTGIAVAKTADAAQLSNALAAAVNELIKNGKMQSIMDKWNKGNGVIAHADVLPIQ